jgi:phenylpropionate dioxygenase-like ring-hydroxylating dioxygenase large terminal subunit
MKPILKSKDYTDSEIFSLEQRDLFLPSWLFVGYTTDLQGEAGWFQFHLFGKSYFVQRDGDSIHCFSNTCSHRHAQLRTTDCGNSAITCPYHGWMFNQDGSVKAVPRKPRFCDITESDLDELKLRSYPLVTWGPLIFVQFNPNLGTSWDNFIQPIKEILDPLIHSIGTFRRRIQKKIKANWKVIIENSVESYHLNCVHPNTFSKLDLGDAVMQTHGLHCIAYSPIGHEAIKKWHRVEPLFSSRFFKSKNYDHAIVFPNLGIGSLYGCTIAIEQYLPLSSTETLYTMDLFGCKLDTASGSTAAAVESFFENSFRFAELIYNEDTEITQIQQRGIESASHEGRLSEDETLIFFLQKTWRNQNLFKSPVM